MDENASEEHAKPSEEDAKPSEEDAKPSEEDAKPSEDAVAAALPDAAALEELGDRDAIFEALWKRCVEAWDDDKPHAAILEHALKSEQLPDLAGRYRALKDDPNKGARAQKKVDGIVLAATQMLMSMKTPPRTKTPWQWTLTAGLMFVLVVGYLIWAVILQHRH